MSELKFAITWSPSVDRRYFNLGWRFKKLELFPPFLRKTSFDHLDEQEYEETPSKPAAFEDTSEDTTVCGNFDFFKTVNPNFRDETTGKLLVPCWDDCRKTGLTCEELREGLDEKSISDELLDVFEHHDDQDYQRFEDTFVDEEEEEEEVEEVESREKSLFPWSDMCEGLLPFSDTEEDPPDTTDPYISHKLYIPYGQIPRPRRFKRTGKEVDYTVTSLPRRPRSPVRKILSGKFDLKVAYVEWDRKQRISETRKRLEESKERISQSIRQLSKDRVDEDVLICSVVLEAVCERVTLTLMGVKIDTDIHTFVNVAVIWALSELELFNRDMLFHEQSRLPEDFEFHDRNQKNIFGDTSDGGMRKLLLGVYRPAFSHNIYTTLHRRLPWPYVSPSHEQGHARLYPNIRERIDEKVSKTVINDSTSTHIPDVTCFHLRDISEKSYVTYKRKSKFRPTSLNDPVKMAENLFLQLVSFM